MKRDRVIFRKWTKEGNEIIALFPDIDGDMTPGSCLSYMHIGQHGSADYNGIIRASKPAKAEEYLDLYLELERIGYRLSVRRRR